MKRLALYVFIDALGWEIYQKYGFLADLNLNSRRLETTFGFSSAADPSILTGRYPDEHTHWSSFIYNPQESPFKLLRYMSLLPPVLFDRWRVRHNLSKLIKRINGWTGYFELYSVPFQYLPYFDYLEKRDYFVPGGILATDTIFDWCVKKGVPYYCSNWRDSEDKILLANKQVISEAKVKFCYVYLPKLDGVMHSHGPFSVETEAKLRDLEVKIKDLHRFAEKVYDEVSLYVISDHGMAPVHASCDLMPKIESLPYQYGKDYIAFYDSTMARFWFFNERARHEIIETLETTNCGSIVDQETMRSLRVGFPHDRFGQIYYLMNEGVLLNPSYMGLKPVDGMHGYHPGEIHSYAMMLSNRIIPKEIQSITDIRKTMESELAE